MERAGECRDECGRDGTVIPDNLPPGLTVRDLYHIMGEAEGEDYAALGESQFDEDDRVNDERRLDPPERRNHV